MYPYETMYTHDIDQISENFTMLLDTAKEKEWDEILRKTTKWLEK